MNWTIWDTRVVVSQIDELREPYRGNLLRWFERFTMEPLHDLDQDLHRFLLRLNPVVREEFVHQTRLLLRDAIRFFGVSRQFGPPRREGAMASTELRQPRS